jgi:hypothetical protein
LTNREAGRPPSLFFLLLPALWWVRTCWKSPSGCYNHALATRENRPEIAIRALMTSNIPLRTNRGGAGQGRQLAGPPSYSTKQPVFRAFYWCRRAISTQPQPPTKLPEYPPMIYHCAGIGGFGAAPFGILWDVERRDDRLPRESLPLPLGMSLTPQPRLTAEPSCGILPPNKGTGTMFGALPGALSQVGRERALGPYCHCSPTKAPTARTIPAAWGTAPRQGAPHHLPESKG